MSICYINGRYIQKIDSKISIEDRGLNFSDGVYEVIRFNKLVLLNFKNHMDRLNRSLDELTIKFPFFNNKTLKIILDKLLYLNYYKKGFIYLQITRGSATRNHLFPKKTKPNVLISIYPEPDIPSLKKGVKIILTKDLRWKRCDIKSISLLPNVLGKQLAHENGCYESWQLDYNDFITEGTTSNAFIIMKNGNIKTHPINNNILGGVTRNTLIEVARENNFSISQKPFSKQELFECKEAFLTSTTVGVLPVTEVQKKQINRGLVGVITRELIEKYDNFLENQTK